MHYFLSCSTSCVWLSCIQNKSITHSSFRFVVVLQQVVSRAVFGSRVEARSICFEGVYCSVIEQVLGVRLSVARFVGAGFFNNRKVVG